MNTVRHPRVEKGAVEEGQLDLGHNLQAILAPQAKWWTDSFRESPSVPPGRSCMHGRVVAAADTRGREVCSAWNPVAYDRVRYQRRSRAENWNEVL
jgi:hypothetical protein